MTEAETNQSRRRFRLPTHHSTSELIPNDHKQRLKAKRQQLMRKFNRVADQIYKLQYDTEYEQQELNALKKQGQEIFQKVVENRERLKGQRETVRERKMEKIVLDLKLDKIEERSTEVSEKSVSLGQQIQWKSIEQPISQTRESQTERVQATRQKTFSNSQILRRNSLTTPLRTPQSLPTKQPSKAPKKDQKASLYPLTEMFLLVLGLSIIYLLI